MKVVIIGAGTTAKMAVAVLRQHVSFEVVGLTHNDEELVGKKILGLSVMGTHDILGTLFRQGVRGAVVAIGYDNATREKYFHQAKKIGFELINLVDPTAHIDRDVIFGKGIIIMPGCIISPGVKIDDNVIVEAGSVIGVDTSIGANVYLGIGCRVGGASFILRNAHIGTGCSVAPGVNVGKNTIIAPGTAVGGDVPDLIRTNTKNA